MVEYRREPTQNRRIGLILYLTLFHIFFIVMLKIWNVTIQIDKEREEVPRLYSSKYIYLIYYKISYHKENCCVYIIIYF